MTKLSIIKAAIHHIHTLHELLSERRAEKCVESQIICEQSDLDHDLNHDLKPQVTLNLSEDSDQSLIPFSILTQSRRSSDDVSVYDNFNVKVEEVTEECISEHFVILEPSQESTIIPLEQEFTTEYPPLIYLDYHANIITQDI